MALCPYSFYTSEALDKKNCRTETQIVIRRAAQTKCVLYKREIVEPSGSDESSENEDQK